MIGGGDGSNVSVVASSSFLTRIYRTSQPNRSNALIKPRHNSNPSALLACLLALLFVCFNEIFPYSEDSHILGVPVGTDTISYCVSYVLIKNVVVSEEVHTRWLSAG
jgi:hypothetical protein